MHALLHRVKGCLVHVLQWATVGSEMMVVVPSLLVPRHWWELGAEGPGLCFPCGRERQREGISTYLISMGTSHGFMLPDRLGLLSGVLWLCVPEQVEAGRQAGSNPTPILRLAGFGLTQSWHKSSPVARPTCLSSYFCFCLFFWKQSFSVALAVLKHTL